MDAKKFLSEYFRMCQVEKCEECGLYKNDGYMSKCLFDYIDSRNEILIPQIVDIIEKWSIEHPIKTRKMDFYEKHPNALKTNNGYPPILPITLGYCKDYKWCNECPYNDKNKLDDCWEMSL